ncbi:MAG TPA: hypothetical protein VFN23_11915, partial [Ktedonobacteraceae bacterium]|nr:hypothetical protein [Ktedonobacteraceae bacterium]
VTVFSPQYSLLYANFLVSAAHTVYTSIFLMAGILCLLALLPALFLSREKPELALSNSKDQALSVPREDYTPEREISSNEQR